MIKALQGSSKRNQQNDDKFFKARTIQNKNKYRHYKVLHSKKNLKKLYCAEKIQNCQRNMNKILHTIKEVIGKAKSTEINLPERMVLYGIETFNQKQIAKRSNKFFAEIGPKLCVLNSKFF